MSIRRLILITGLASATISGAIACGPNFPWQLLDDRSATMAATPANSFAFEAARLAPHPSDGLIAVEEPPPYVPPAEPGRQPEHDRRHPAPDAAAPPTSEAERIYKRGADAFVAYDDATAIAQFTAVLQLPEAEQASRATRAAYTLGRLYVDAGDDAKASDAFKLTRALALKGVPDPQGLAVASYGEEARPHLAQANMTAATAGDGELAPDQATAYRAQLAQAVALYAEQAARGSVSGTNSLQLIADDLFFHEKKMVAAIGDPLVERLVVVYALARTRRDARWAVPTNFGDPERPPEAFFAKLAAALDARGDAPVPYADRLAAAAYRGGRFAFARKLVAHADGPMADWVRAKLALQQGNRAAAATFYAAAMKAAAAANDAMRLDDSRVTLLDGEAGLLALSRGDYVEALDLIYGQGTRFWGDAAYVAERLVTIDELMAFVDRHPVPQVLADVGTTSLAADLHNLLARRLVRAGRFEEALRYVAPAPQDVNDDPALPAHITAYAEALHRAHSRRPAIDRAQAFFDAAVLARRFGLHMLAYEEEPDYFANAAEFPFGYGPTRLGGPYSAAGEQKRYAATAAKPPLRFHYRYIAADLAAEAANLLPPHSEAFAAVLCTGTSWLIKRRTDEAEADRRVRRMYRRYVRDGRAFDWAHNFGSNCPAPNFTTAATGDH